MTHPFPDDASLHVHFPETRLDVSRGVDALLDSLKRGKEDHIDEGRAADTDTKTCFSVNRCSGGSNYGLLTSV